jgi:hypothetical protein
METVALWDLRMASRARVCAELLDFVDNRVPNPEKSKVRIRLWDFATKAIRTVAEFDDVVPGELGIAPEANLVAMGGGNASPLRMVESSTGRTLWMDRDVKQRVGPLTFSAKGTALAAGIGGTKGGPKGTFYFSDLLVRSARTQRPAFGDSSVPAIDPKRGVEGDNSLQSCQFDLVLNGVDRCHGRKSRMSLFPFLLGYDSRPL